LYWHLHNIQKIRKLRKEGKFLQLFDIGWLLVSLHHKPPFQNKRKGEKMAVHYPLPCYRKKECAMQMISVVVQLPHELYTFHEFKVRILLGTSNRNVK